MKKLAILFTICSIYLLASLTLNAQTLTSQLDALINKEIQQDTPGLSILVAKDGKILYKKAFGAADLELQVLMTPQHVLELGSITKQFTATAILMLEEQKKLKITDPISNYIPDYPNGKNITIHHLLTHTSGIKSYTSMNLLSIARQDMTVTQLIDFFKNEPIDFEPGEKWEYNNSGYILLGYIIEKVSGETYAQFIQNSIFDPLGMKNSYYGSRVDIIKNRASGYQQIDEVYKNAEYLSHSLPYAAGSLMATVDDMLLWNTAIANNTLISEASKQKAFANYPTNDGKLSNYGYGWFPNEVNGTASVEHSGGIFGYSTYGLYVPKENVYVIALSNCQCFSPGEIAIHAAALAMGKPYPQGKSNVSVSTDALKKLEGVYEFEDGTLRNISLENGTLYSQREGSTKLMLQPKNETEFYFDNSGFNEYKFDVSKNPVQVLFKNRLAESSGKRTNKKLNEATKEITVSENILKQYVGVYELQKGFDLTVTLEDGKLMTQATGQAKVQVYPESETSFFLKVVPAKIEFIKDENGVSALILKQGGREMKANKK